MEPDSVLVDRVKQGDAEAYEELVSRYPIRSIEDPLDENDWMATDHVIACPDPHCGARFRISRIGKRVVKRADTTVEPLPGHNPWKE